MFNYYLSCICPAVERTDVLEYIFSIILPRYNLGWKNGKHLLSILKIFAKHFNLDVDNGTQISMTFAPVDYRAIRLNSSQVLYNLSNI